MWTKVIVVRLWILRLDGGTDIQDRHMSQINPLTVLYFMIYSMSECECMCVCIRVFVFDKKAEREFTFMNVCGNDINLALVSSIVGSPTKSVTPQPSAIG